MSYHYLLELDLFATQESICKGVIRHNLENITDFRIDYLGCTGDEEEGVSDKLLITGLSTQIHQLKQFDTILTDFAAYLQIDYLPDTYRGDCIPYLGYTPVPIHEVMDYYRPLTGTIDRGWFPNGTKLSLSADEEEELYGSIKTLYYDYHLQYQLSDQVRKEYDVYRAQREEFMEFSEEQRKTVKEMDATFAFLFPGYTILNFDLKKGGIRYGGYHIAAHLHNIAIAPYARDMGFEADIKDRGFAGCEILERVIINEEITDFGAAAFENCINLKEISFNNDTKEIPTFTFYNCRSLTKAVLPEQMERIGSYAFLGCSAYGKEHLALPNTLEEIGTGAFIASGLVSIDLHECTKLEKIPLECFRGCGNLKKIELAEGLTKIGDRAFSGCTNLENITIPSTVKEMGYEVFADCLNLESITFYSNEIILDHFEFDKTAITTLIKCKEGSNIHEMAMGMKWNFELIN